MGLIPQRDYFDKDIANSDNTSGYYIIEHNDFVYNPRKSSDAPYGPISRYAYPDAGIVSPLYLCFRANGGVDTNFFEWYFRSSVWHRYIYMTGDSGARHDRVSIKDDDFFSMPIRFPSATEQKKIAAFLNIVERRITSQQLLVDNLKKYKRGLISEVLKQKLVLSREGEKWEKVSLSDVADGFEYGMNAAATSFDGEHKYIRITDIDDDAHTYIASDPVSPSGVLEEKYRVRENDILFARTGASVGKSYLYRKTDGDLFFAGFLIRIHIKEGVDSGYVFLNTLTEDYDKWVLLESARSGQPGINAEQYKRYSFKLPPLKIQKQISGIAQKMDEQIKREYLCLRLLQKQRDGILQQLFI